MYKVGELVVYGTVGVMELVDIREETVADVTKTYYVLRESGSVSDSMTYVPIDNEKLIAGMRSVITREEALALIDRAKEIPEAEWHKDNRVRSEKFRKIIESGNRDSIISMIKAIYENGKRRNSEGKKNYLLDEILMQKAEKLLYSEISFALGIPESEVTAFFVKRIENNN